MLNEPNKMQKWNLRTCEGFDVRSIESIELIEFEISPQRLLLVGCSECGETHSTDVPSNEDSPVEALLNDLTATCSTTEDVRSSVEIGGSPGPLVYAAWA
jgi:hypothetical protein